MIYRPSFRLVLSSLERPEERKRAYAVIMDPHSDDSGIWLGGVPWDTDQFNDPATNDTFANRPTHTAGSLGLVSLHTQENMHSHGCSLSLLVGSIGEQLRRKVLPHDPLRVEIFDTRAQVWRCAFDGHLSNIQWSRQSSPGSYRWRMDMAAEGIQKVFSEQWLDWQGMIRAADAKIAAGSKGFSFFQELANVRGNLPVSDLISRFIAGAVDQFLEFGVRGVRAGQGRTFQTAWDLRDWSTFKDLFVFATGNWYLMQRGAIWGILSGLAEPDVHEFFITYDQENPATASEFREIPTVVFRPRPWPGAPAASSRTGKDDDSLWPRLDVVLTGLPGEGPAAFSVGTSRHDGARSNAFFISLSGASDSTPEAMDGAKYALGFRVDEGLVKRYGFSMRQVSIGSYLKRSPEYFDTILPEILDRVAWQEAPLPFLLDQTRSFPLMPGVHVGSVLEDHSEDLASPTTGYIISVAHSFTGTPKGIRAETTIGTTRGIEGATAEDYPAKVRALVNLQTKLFLEPDQIKERKAQFTAPAHSQPEPVDTRLSFGPFDLGVSSHPELQDTPSKLVETNLAYLVKKGIEPVKFLAGGTIIITSCYRSLALNRAVGGRDGSYHTMGLAFDFQVPGGDSALLAVFNTLKANKATLNYHELVWETRDGKTWIHFSLPPSGGVGHGSTSSGETGE